MLGPVWWGRFGKVGGLCRVHHAWHICTAFLPEFTESSHPCPSTPTLQVRQLRLGGGEAGLSAALPSTPGRPGDEGAGQDTQTLVTGVGVSNWLTIEILKNIFELKQRDYDEYKAPCASFLKTPV